MGCISCGRFLHDECVDTVDSVCCCQRQVTHESTTVGKGDGEGGAGGGKPNASNPKGRPPKNNELLQNPHATWRARADVEFPLNKEAPCEWRGLRNVGGGKYPIVGCIAGKQQAIHHGPVKITIGFRDDDGLPYNFNQKPNIHRICGRCHNLWHHWNDATFDPSEWAKRPHTPEPAEHDELIKWSNPRTRPTPPYPRTVARKATED